MSNCKKSKQVNSTGYLHMRKPSLLIILLVYSFFALATIFSWNSRGINPVTGDEPHYLVMTSGIVNHGSLEQTLPYKEEFKSREIFKFGLAPQDAQPAPENTHATKGPNGLFNIHNIGLPIILTFPFMIGGVLGAKIFMVFCGSLVIVTIWKLSSHFSENKTLRFWSILIISVSLPFIPASSQIYPDLLAGLISLLGLYWFLTENKFESIKKDILLTTAIAFLPWLQIKFAASFIILLTFIVIKIYLQSKNLPRIAQILTIAILSCTALMYYNWYAFGKVSGPYSSGALEISKTSLMVLIGLFLDQNQGFLFQNPTLLVGILGIGWMYKFNRTFTLLWGLVFLSLIVPNALHPNWYGGGSFSGRFHWAATITFLVPTVYALLNIARRNHNLFKAIVIFSLIVQIYFFFKYALMGENLYRKSIDTWFDTYSIFYNPIHSWLPMLYNKNWAYNYWPNLTWSIGVFLLFLQGFCNKESLLFKAKPITFTLIFVMLLASGFTGNPNKDKAIFQAIKLPSQTGRIIDSFRFAEHNIDNTGFITYGPYFPLTEGKHEIALSYKSSAEKTENIGWIDIFNTTSGKKLVQTPIYGTKNMDRTLIIDFETNHWGTNIFEFRVYWNGLSNIQIQNIIIKKQ
ncbi:hypothetical protein O4H50_19625 [Vibrio diazotrophicus]|uniref:hypothetical protein n=1 Tax=Vibrio diazotrophicus TaxID=685 RepID=UPI0022B03D9E|nr:hypothetical protein [Vibrio diazotrophicus]MCZ4374013.1 hypothetical protein [Vibrio diazotrophicus]